MTTSSPSSSGQTFNKQKPSMSEVTLQHKSTWEATEIILLTQRHLSEWSQMFWYGSWYHGVHLNAALVILDLLTYHSEFNLSWQRCSWAVGQVSPGQSWLCNGSHMMKPPALLGYVNFASTAVPTNQTHQRNLCWYFAKQFLNEHQCLYQRNQPECRNILPKLEVSPSPTEILHIPQRSFWPILSPLIVISPASLIHLFSLLHPQSEGAMPQLGELFVGCAQMQAQGLWWAPL